MAFPAFWQYFSNLKYLKPKVPPQPKVLPLQKKWCPSKKVPPGETAPFPCSSCYHLILVFSANHSHKNAIVPSHTKNHWLSFLNLFGCLHNLILNYLELKLAKIFSIYIRVTDVGKNLVMQVMSEKGTSKRLTEKLMLLVNRGGNVINPLPPRGSPLTSKIVWCQTK